MLSGRSVGGSGPADFESWSCSGTLLLPLPSWEGDEHYLPLTCIEADHLQAGELI